MKHTMQTYEQLKEDKPNTADRLAYVDFKLRFTGIVKRSDIGEMFNIGTAAASKVLAEYNELCPGNMEHNSKLKTNAIQHDSYKPLLNTDAETALGMLANGFNKNKLFSKAKTVIEYTKIGKVPNQLSSDCISKITRAIAGEYAITSRYLSENSENHEPRTIVPLAIMYDGVNWMFRGFDRSSNKPNSFKNFHFSRCRDVVEHFGEPSYKRTESESLELDKSWNMHIPLELKLHDSLGETAKRRVRTDFGMADGENKITIPTQHAFLWILKKKWFLDDRDENQKAEDEELAKKNRTKPRYYKFELLNKSSVDFMEKQLEQM